MTDRIVLAGLEVFARHGALATEAERGQTFKVDVVVSLDLAAAGASDDLADTVDYGALASRIHQVVANERWDLIERVAERVADTVLEDRRVRQVEATVHKPEAPIPLRFGDVSVTVIRARS